MKKKTKIKYYVYQIKINGIVRYIGRTKDLKKREYYHNYNLRKGLNKELYNYCRELNLESLKLQMIKVLDTEIECKRYECLLILKDFFNKHLLKQRVPRISDM